MFAPFSPASALFVPFAAPSTDFDSPCFPIDLGICESSWSRGGMSSRTFFRASYAASGVRPCSFIRIKSAASAGPLLPFFPTMTILGCGLSPFPSAPESERVRPMSSATPRALSGSILPSAPLMSTLLTSILETPEPDSGPGSAPRLPSPPFAPLSELAPSVLALLSPSVGAPLASAPLSTFTTWVIPMS